MPWTYPSGIGFASHRMSGWGVGVYDFNNDGLKDLFIANSHVSENVGLYGNHQYRKPNAVFASVGKGTFRNVSPQAGTAMNVPAAHRGAAFGDLNNDGRVDAVVSVIGRPAEPSLVTRTLTPSAARVRLAITVVPPARCPWCTPGSVVTLSSPPGP